MELILPGHLSGPHFSWAFFLFLAVLSLLIKMFNDNTNLDVESTDHEQPIQSELDPLIQCNQKRPTIKEERVARAQFLALCWALFVVGWNDGSTGPLLPRIQTVYEVS